MSINDGGRAFPRTSDAYGPEFGMSLRDYFAAKAMQGVLCSGSQWPDQKIAELAYAMADAMLVAREVQS